MLSIPRYRFLNAFLWNNTSKQTWKPKGGVLWWIYFYVEDKKRSTLNIKCLWRPCMGILKNLEQLQEEIVSLKLTNLFETSSHLHWQWVLQAMQPTCFLQNKISQHAGTKARRFSAQILASSTSIWYFKSTELFSWQIFGGQTENRSRQRNI